MFTVPLTKAGKAPKESLADTVRHRAPASEPDEFLQELRTAIENADTELLNATLAQQRRYAATLHPTRDADKLKALSRDIDELLQLATARRSAILNSIGDCQRKLTVMSAYSSRHE
jgi:hypothetical protein